VRLEVHPIAEFATENGPIEDIIVIDRMDDGDLALRVCVREAEVIDRTGVEIATIAFAGNK
jgi:hypothetical protein